MPALTKGLTAVKDNARLTVNLSPALAGVPPGASDPNRYDDPQYVVRLIGQVVRVSVETVTTVMDLAEAFASSGRYRVAGGKKAKSKNRKPRAVAPPKFGEYGRLRMEGATMRLRAAKEIVSHPGTRGSLAENLVRDMIRDFLPTHWAVATGFVMDSVTGADGKPAGVRSDQVDVLIYDQHHHSPVFKDGELVILAPGAASVAVEVKSELATGHTPKAFDNICSGKMVDPNINGFVFGYDAAEWKTFVDDVKAWERKAGAPGREYWPERVFNMGQRFLMLPDPASANTPADRRFVVAAEKDPVVQLFLTAVLAEAGVDRVRAFFMTENTGDELAAF